MEGITLRCLNLLHTVLFGIENHDDLVSTMQKYIITSYIPLKRTEGILGETYQMFRRQHNQNERDRLQQERVSLPFRGDEEVDGPPLAWTLIWSGTYSNLYGTI